MMVLIMINFFKTLLYRDFKKMKANGSSMNTNAPIDKV